MRRKSKLILTAVMLLGTILNSAGQDNLVLAPSNRSTTSLEKNLLFNATNFYTVSQSGGISLGLDGLFDGYFEPQYSGALNEADPYVVVIEGLPNKHVQTGAWIGWTTRAYQPIKFKIEVYNVYDYGIPGYPAPNTWVTVAEESDYNKNQYLTQVSSVAVAKIRFTFYKGAGPSNSIGISELFFIHPEAVKAYDNLMVQYSTNGNVGIGTSNPISTLHVNGNQILNGDLVFPNNQTAYFVRGLGNGGAIRLRSNVNSTVDRDVQFGNFDNNGVWSSFMTVANNSKVGIGTTNPMAALHVQADANTSGAPANAQLFVGGATNPGMRLSLAYNTSSNYGEIQAQAYDGAYAPVTLNPNGGNVLVGKTAQANPAYKLDVNGKVRANEIVVNTTGADFVFENNYRLRPLAEVEKFVKENKHLPEIPTAKAMQQEGVGVSELQTKLLQKVEELTLYLIEMKKENEKLRDRIVQLEKKAQ